MKNMPRILQNWLRTCVLANRVAPKNIPANTKKPNPNGIIAVKIMVILANITPSLFIKLVFRSLVNRPLLRIISDHGRARQSKSVVTIVQNVQAFKCLPSRPLSNRMRKPASNKSRPSAMSAIGSELDRNPPMLSKTDRRIAPSPVQNVSASQFAP